ncbi:MAG: sigma-70 family RNA polymerase sigma factor [Verrucomicrobiales bacterium]|nr:sigma-70 family RNA polymerase sigma factor [Verrucomicrobiales bacterium]
MSALTIKEFPDPYEEQIESVQHRLRGYVFSLLGNNADMQDVVQETNRVLWRKREQFENGTNFWAWAAKIAYFQVMAHRKKLSRDRHVFGEELLHLMADEMSADDESIPETGALDQCLGKLPDRQRIAVEHFYLKDQSLAEISTILELNENAVSQLLFRARKSLRHCLRYAGNPTQA